MLHPAPWLGGTLPCWGLGARRGEALSPLEPAWGSGDGVDGAGSWAVWGYTGLHLLGGLWCARSSVSPALCQHHGSSPPPSPAAAAQAVLAPAGVLPGTGPALGDAAGAARPHAGTGAQAQPLLPQLLSLPPQHMGTEVAKSPPGAALPQEQPFPKPQNRGPQCGEQLWVPPAVRPCSGPQPPPHHRRPHHPCAQTTHITQV